MTLGIGLQGKARLTNAAPKTDAGHHVLQRAAIRQVIEHVVGRHHRQRQVGQHTQTTCIIATITPVGGNIGPTSEILLQALDIGAKVAIQAVRCDDQQDLSFTVFQQIGVVQEATVGGLGCIAGIAMRHTSLADGKQTRQPSPGGTVPRIAEQIRCGVAE